MNRQVSMYVSLVVSLALKGTFNTFYINIKIHCC